METAQDIVRTHRLYFEECEMLQAVYDRAHSPNVLAGPARMLTDAMAHFAQGQEEVTLITTQTSFSIANTVELDPRKCG